MSPKMTMTVSTGRVSGWPKSSPLPAGIEAPPEIAKASAAYAAAVERLQAAEDRRRAASKAAKKAAVRDSQAKTKAAREGRPEPTGEAPALREEERKLTGERDKALAEAVELELAYTGAIAEEQEAWLDEIADARRDAADVLERALEDLGLAIEATQALQVMETRLQAWRHDETADPKTRAQRLRSEGGRLDLSPVSEAVGRPVARRMQLIETYAKQKAT